MANNRKVQAEIDRLLKKCVEGFEIYDEMYHKAESTPATAKMADQLRREVKKLQRFRDEIKGHIASPEVKDTNELEDMQKEIESRMQRFKTIEREMKTKTFSKEGLAAAGDSDTPLAQVEAFLKGVITQGRARVEIVEYEATQAARSRSRKTKANPEKTEAQIKLENLQQHLYSWETLLRMLDNEEVDPSEIEDDMKSHIQEVLEEDADAEVLADMSCYEPFDIPDKPVVKVVPKPDPDAEAEPTASPKQAMKKTPAEPAVSASKSTPATPAVKAPPTTTASSPKVTAPPAAQPAAKPVVVPPPARVEPPQPAAAAALEPQEDDEMPEWADDDQANDDTFGDDLMMPAGVGDLASMAQATSTRAQDWEQDKLKFKQQQQQQQSAAAAPAAPASAPAAAPAPPVNEWERRRLQQQAAQAAAAAAAAAAQPTPAAAETAAPASATAAVPASTQRAAPAPAAAATAAASSAAPSSAKATPLPTSSASHAHGSRHAAPLDATAMHRMLDMSLANLPHTLDVEKQRPFEPPNAIEPIPYFPQEVHPVFASRDIYGKFDEETLFFIFYYNQKTYHQYFAAKELKQRSYRFHTELKRWFLRRDKPKEATTERERGAYMYFDYEDTWSKKETDDFTFEYKYLEDDL